MADEHDIDFYFHLLGLHKGDSLAAVKRAYRFDSQAFHPDKYEAGSQQQARAKERQIQINDAYERVTKWIEENPDYKPEVKADKPLEESEEVNWDNWEADRSREWDKVQSDWEAQAAINQFEEKAQKDKEKRQRRATRLKIGAVLVVVLAWIGLNSNNGWVRSMRFTRVHEIDDAIRYDMQTHGTSNSAYSQSAQSIADKWGDVASAQRSAWDQEDKDKKLGYLLLLVLTGGVAWVLFAKKPKQIVQNWIDGVETPKS
jgi:hypothetical protein